MQKPKILLNNVGSMILLERPKLLLKCVSTIVEKGQYIYWEN